MEPFAVMDCALITVATGRRALNLRELAENLREVDADSIYHHFWGALLRPGFDQPEFNNDFAAWARHGLHDHVLAERLAVVDPADYGDLEELRRDLLDIIEERLDEREFVPWARPDQQFNFLTAVLVVFDTHVRLAEPGELPAAVAAMSLGSVFYHFIDARRREPMGQDDFRAWLCGADGRYRDLCAALGAVDPSFSALSETRGRLAALFAAHLGGGQA